MKRYNSNNEKIKELEKRLIYALKVKETLEEYKKYCVEYYRYECDNTEKRIAERKERLEIIGDEQLQKIVNNTYLFARFLIGLMKEENNKFQNNIFTSINYQEIDYIYLGCTGGRQADDIYEIDYNGKTLYVSNYLLKNILDGLTIEQDYDVEEKIDGDIGCMYSYPKLNFSMSIKKFNEYYQEFFGDNLRKIRI